MDALIFGYCEGEELILRRTHVQRVRAGEPRSVVQKFRASRSLSAHSRTFPKRGAFDGARASANAKMAECLWLKPVLVGQFEFLEWSAGCFRSHFLAR